jgi:type IV secretory pathway TraG/TraD family ATPase VirD4
VPDAHPKLLPADASLPKAGRILGDATASLSTRPVAIRDEDALRHLHVLGPTGSGKSQVLGNVALQSMERGQSVVVLDPKGALVDDLLERIPADRREDVVIIDPLDVAPVGLNGLQPGLDADRSADALLAVFHSLYADNWGPRTHDVLHASLLTLARRGDASLAMIPTLLTNPGFRRSVTGRAIREDPMGLGAFWGWFEAISDAERTQAVAPLMNKLRPILLRRGMRAVFGQRRPKFDLADVFTNKRIVLISLAKGRLGPEAAQLLGSIAVALIWDAARVRAATSGPRHHVSLIIDEVQDYLRLGDIGDALAQARSMGLGIVAANQSFSQFSPSMREAFLTNARSRVAFQQSPKDARELTALSRGQVEVDDFLALPAYQAYAQILVEGTTAPWVSLSTRLMPPPTSDPSAIRELSRRTYGQPLSEVEADLLSLTETVRQGGGDRIGRSRRPPADTDSEGSR